MPDGQILILCVCAALGLIAFGKTWLLTVGDLLWMACLSGWTVFLSLIAAGLVVGALTSKLLPPTDLAATRLVLVFILAPLPARWLADLVAWLRTARTDRGRYKSGFMFDRAAADQQSDFIRSLADIEPGTPDHG